MSGISGKIEIKQGRLNAEVDRKGQRLFCNENSKIWMACEGEIYNSQELRGNLERKGHIFRTKESVEVIIHLYEDSDIASCVNQLRGAFAFALRDEGKQCLILARDRLGQKPLNYLLQEENLIFGSEIKSILEDLQVVREVDLVSLDNYLTYQYVPVPRTMFKGIRKLPPAHILIWQGGKIKLERYWRLSYRHKIRMTEKEVCENILRLLAESIRLRLTGNGNIGMFLSGGIDSSAIAAVSTRLCRRPLAAFSVGFEEYSFNELEAARTIAREFNLEHQEFILTAKQAQEIIPQLIWHYNEPFADSSALATFYLAKMVKPYIDVVLTGDGGDESFAGYDRYKAFKLIKYYEMIPPFLRKSIFEPMVNNLPESTEKIDWANRLKKFTAAANLSAQRRYCEWMSIFSNQQKNILYTQRMQEVAKAVDPYDCLLKAYKNVEAQDIVDMTMGVDVLTYLPDCGIAKVDGAMRACALISRSPFMDDRVVEFAASIPADQKLKGMRNKYILKKAMANLLPRKILSTKKLGWGVPIAKWLKGQMKDFAYEVLLDKRAIKRGYFKPESVRQLLDEHTSGQANHGHRIWSLMVLELWHQRFIDNHNLSNGNQ